MLPGFGFGRKLDFVIVPARRARDAPPGTPRLARPAWPGDRGTVPRSGPREGPLARTGLGKYRGGLAGARMQRGGNPRRRICCRAALALECIDVGRAGSQKPRRLRPGPPADRPGRPGGKEVQVAADRYPGPRLLPQGRRLPVGVPGPHRRPRIHPADRRRPLRRRLHDQLAVQRLPRHPRPHLRPAVRAGLPARPRGEASRWRSAA